jgi:hypothetical protein
MKHGTYQERAFLRHASDLLLELRSPPKVRGLPGQAVTSLRLLERQGESEGLSLVFAVRAARLKSF